MTRTKRLLAVAAGLFLIGASFQTSALANHAISCSITSGANVARGGTLTVTGSHTNPVTFNELWQLRLNGVGIGQSFSDGIGHFNISGQVPANHLEGTFPVDVVLLSGPGVGGTIPCGLVTVTAPPPPPPPAPTPTPTPDAREQRRAARDAARLARAAQPPAPQQQQQQQGIVPFDPAFGPAGGPGQQQQQGGGAGGQQQQQQLIVPASLLQPSAGRAPGAALPKTGYQITEMTQGGVGLLLLGLTMVFMTRRRRRALALAGASGQVWDVYEPAAELDDEPVASDTPLEWADPIVATTPEPMSTQLYAAVPTTWGSSEGDLLLPYWDREQS